MTIRDDLRLPSAYVEVRPSNVELVETHLSWVFVLDEDVFKVKRPVFLGFVDFRTAGLRKAACMAELELNRRLAPEVYLGVVPVRRAADGRHCVGGSGPIVDWAVHMARMPADRRGDVLLAHGQLEPRALDAIAERMADLHRGARCDAETSRLGTPAAIAVNLEENFAQTDGAIRRYLGESESRELVGWQRGFLQTHKSLFEERILKGRVRDGHGDLRLEQLYVHPHPGDGKPAVTILDCIEFNERFRFADVCADVAFLSMDLAAHGRVDLAERFLAAYARASNDFDLYELVDFYESYRAFVRAKVALLQADDEEIDAAVRERARADVRRYFLLALSADRRPLLRPMVVAVGGVIASGKSTVAARIGAAMSAPVVDADRTRKSMVGVEPTVPIHDAAWQGAYDPAVTERVYAETLRRADAVLGSGRPVVLDASFRSVEMRRAARDLARTHGVPFRFVECRAEVNLARARLAERERRAGVSDGRLTIFDAFRLRFEPVVELPSDEHVVLDTSRPLEETDAVLRARLDTWPRGFVA
jgi:aminoglycoside phosphotransferase family enzyme/predicted kinase